MKNLGKNNVIKNTKEVARFLGVSTQTVYRWINEKDMPYIKLGNGRRGYNIEEIEKWWLGEKQ